MTNSTVYCNLDFRSKHLKQPCGHSPAVASLPMRPSRFWPQIIGESYSGFSFPTRSTLCKKLGLLPTQATLPCSLFPIDRAQTLSAEAKLAIAVSEPNCTRRSRLRRIDVDLNSHC